MRMTWRDSFATLFVVLAVAIYVAWALGSPIATFDSVMAIASAVLVLGVAASIFAVVPGFDGLIHGSRSYLAGSSVLGLLAFVTAAWSLLTEDALALSALVGATVLLWGMATVRHLRLQRPEVSVGHP